MNALQRKALTNIVSDLVIAEIGSMENSLLDGEDCGKEYFSNFKNLKDTLQWTFEHNCDGLTDTDKMQIQDRAFQSFMKVIIDNKISFI